MTMDLGRIRPQTYSLSAETILISEFRQNWNYELACLCLCRAMAVVEAVIRVVPRRRFPGQWLPGAHLGDSRYPARTALN